MNTSTSSSVFPLKASVTEHSPYGSTSGLTEGFAESKKHLQIDPTRDLLSSMFAHTGITVDANLFLEEGVSLSGTHYGLNLISTKGVVLITESARILPSATRKSTIAADKIISAGEMILGKVQGDSMIALTDNSKTMMGEVVRGGAFVTTEKSLYRCSGGIRELTKREKRVEALYADAIKESRSRDETNSYDAVCAAMDSSLDLAEGNDNATDAIAGPVKTA